MPQCKIPACDWSISHHATLAKTLLPTWAGWPSGSLIFNTWARRLAAWAGKPYVQGGPKNGTKLITT